MSDDIVELIDGALRDYTTSTDAMRWAPGPDEPNALNEVAAEFWASGMQARNEALRGIVTAMSSPSPSDPGRTILDDLLALRETVLRDPYDHPLPARIEVDELALDALRVHAVYQTRPPWDASVDNASGIPIRINPRLPRGGWRVLDRDGNVLREGVVRR